MHGDAGPRDPTERSELGGAVAGSNNGYDTSPGDKSEQQMTPALSSNQCYDKKNVACFRC